MKTVFNVICISVLALLPACSGGENKYDAQGTFEATEVIVSSEVPGRLIYFNMEEGDTLSAGEMAGTIDTVQLYLQKMQLQKSIESVVSGRPAVKKQIAALEERLKKQKTEKARIERLLRDGAATSKQLDDVNSSVKVLENELSAKLSSLDKSVSSIDARSSSMEIELAAIEDRLGKCYIKSPVSGTVLAKYAECGEFAPVGRPLFKVADIRHMYLRAYITSLQLNAVKLGQSAKVYADFGGGVAREYDGRVTFIASESEFTPNNIQTEDDRQDLVYAVKIMINNDGYAKTGMFGKVKFE